MGYFPRGNRIKALEALGIFFMLGVRNGIDRRASQWLVLAIGTLVGAILLLGILCHHPDAQGFVPGQAHLAHASAEHCPTWISSVPTLSLVMLCVAIFPATLTFRQVLLFTSLFKPPRPLSPIRSRFIPL